MSSLTELEARRGKLIEDIANATAAKDSADRAAARAANAAQFATDPNSKSRFESQAERARGESTLQAARITSLSAELAEVNAQIAELQRKQGPRESAGQTGAQASRARDEAASVNNPPSATKVVSADGTVTTPPATATPSNAQQFRANADVAAGGDQRRRLATTQATPPITARPGGARPSPEEPYTSQSAGAGAASDDASSNGVRAQLNNLFGGSNQRIIPQANVLDQYASYTYNISIYLMSPAEYQKLMQTKQRNIAGWQLLMSSGGAPASSGEATAYDPQELEQQADGNGNSTDLKSLGRNQFFPLDYYLEDLRLTSLVSGKGVGGANNVFKMEFKIIEPNGVSLLPNLYSATQQYVGASSGQDENYAAQNYLMVIRFYGYDENGNLVQAGKTGLDSAGSSSTAIVEKFIPFQFTGIKFRIANKLTEYECSAVCPQDAIASSASRGVIPYNVELQSQTLKELFTGNLGFSSPQQTGQVQQGRTANAAERAGDEARETSSALGVGSLFDLELGGAALATGVEVATGTDVTTRAVVAGTSPTQNQAPPKANAAATPVLTTGVAEALNKYQAELVEKGTYEVADQYEIVITDSIIADAKVVPPGRLDKSGMPMIQATTAGEAKLGSKQTNNTDAKNTAATAGMSVVQFLDQYTRTSTYIYDQQKYIIDPETQKLIPSGKPASVLGWYHIGLQATPLKYDNKRNDYAYKITYELSPYKVSDVQSDYFPQSKFQGTHKKYNYWFTGENTQIIDLQQDYNYLYYLVVNTQQPTRTTGTTTNYREYIKKSFSPRSPQSSQGDKGAVNEPSANAADYLYSPADQARIKMTIVGDPAWIQQGELWTGIKGLRFNYGPFEPDGTINYESQEILFEVAWNQPVDYDLNTGLLDPGQKNYNANRSQGIAGEATQSYVYRATEVTSMFSRGRFTQELNGVIVQYELPDDKAAADTERAQTNTAAATSGSAALRGPDQSAAETKRLQQNAAKANSGGRTWAERQQQAATKVNAARRQQLGLSNTGLATDSLAAEGFTQPAPQPPTSGGQVVGTASDPAITRSSGQVATGTAVGQPVTVPVRTISGATINVTSQGEISDLYVNDKISQAEYERSNARLEISQARANAPVTSKPNQAMRRET